MLPRQFENGIKVIEKLTNANHKAYFVGGAVRDYYLNRSITDIDIATSAKPKEVQALFKRTVKISDDHETIVVIYEGDTFEITTFRGQDDQDASERTLERDLHHRDFTMNALAMDVKGSVVDIVGGLADMEKKEIRVINQDKARFLEDPLRMLRAIRFQSELGFQIESETFAFIVELADLIKSVAMERVLVEFERIFAGKHMKLALISLNKSGLSNHLPCFQDSDVHIEALLDLTTELRFFHEVLAYLYLKNSHIALSTWCKKWKCSRKTKKQSEQLIQAVKQYEQAGLTKLLVYHLNEDLYASFTRILSALKKADVITLENILSVANDLPIQSREELNINGSEIIDLFPHLQRGPWIEQVLRQLEEHVLAGDLANDNNTLKEWIKCHPPVND